MINDSKPTEKKDITVKVDNFLIDFFDTIPNTDIKGKSDKIVDILLNSNIKVKDYPKNKVLSHINIPEDIEEKLRIKQKECGFTNFSHFVNANLRKFYDDRHVYHEKVGIKKREFKPKINFAKFKRLIKKCKKNLLTGEYTSYDKNVKRCYLSEEQLVHKIDDYKKRRPKDCLTFNCYSEVKWAITKGINCDSLEAYIIHYIRAHSGSVWSAEYVNGYNDLIGLNADNFKEYELKIIEKENVEMKTIHDITNKDHTEYPDILKEINKHILEHYDFEIPDIDTYFYLWIYFMYRDDEVYSTVNFVFNTDDEYAEKLLEKYTVDNIIYHYLKLDNQLSIENIFDNEIIEHLNNNELIDLSNLYQKNI